MKYLLPLTILVGVTGCGEEDVGQPILEEHTQMVISGKVILERSVSSSIRVALINFDTNDYIKEVIVDDNGWFSFDVDDSTVYTVVAGTKIDRTAFTDDIEGVMGGDDDLLLSLSEVEMISLEKSRGDLRCWCVWSWWIFYRYCCTQFGKTMCMTATDGPCPF